MRDYSELRRLYLDANPYCLACGLLGFQKRRHYATQIHHKNGRGGTLLCETKYWVGVCQEAHDTIGAQPNLAREAGLLCEVGEWNTTERNGKNESRT